MTAKPKKSKAPLPPNTGPSISLLPYDHYWPSNAVVAMERHAEADEAKGFADAIRACRTPAEREHLALVLLARWTSGELHEYARLFFFKNGKDYPTAMSYRRALAGLARHYSGLPFTGANPSHYPHGWLDEFRKGGSKPMPPRRAGLLQRGRGETLCVSSEEYAWPEHSEEYRSLIEQQARDYFKIAPERPVHVNAWAASQRAYWREQHRGQRG